MRWRIVWLFGLLTAAPIGCDSADEAGQFQIDPEPPGPDAFGTPTQEGSGQTSDRYGNADVVRDGVNYMLMPNGWGPGFESQTISWNGTSFVVESMTGTQGENYQPASYPTVFCGHYSNAVSGECGLPAAASDITTLRTGWSWRPNDNTGAYNAAYDIWISDSLTGGLTGYLMVWLRDPPAAQPAGTPSVGLVEVDGVPGKWRLWVGDVNGRPIVNYARNEGQDSYGIEFDVMDFWRDMAARDVALPGSVILAVAVGFEIWSGPIANLETKDFYVDVN
jgi:hypothetical protein